MIITVETNISATLAKELAEKCTQAEHIVAVQIQKDTEPFVPMLTGSLNTRTEVVGGSVIYPPPYSRFLYYGKVMIDPETGSTWAKAGRHKVVTDRDLVFTKDFHPQAQAFWFEASKAQNIDKWLRVAQKAVAEYGE